MLLTIAQFKTQTHSHPPPQLRKTHTVQFPRGTTRKGGIIGPDLSAAWTMREPYTCFSTLVIIKDMNLGTERTALLALCGQWEKGVVRKDLDINVCIYPY